MYLVHLLEPLSSMKGFLKTEKAQTALETARRLLTHNAGKRKKLYMDS